MQHRVAAALAFVSGFVALGYEILWARRLSDIIGATSLASSLVVGVFFVLLAAGAIALGPLATRQRSPWRLYALLEGCILVAILPAFFGEELAGAVARTFGDALLRPGASLALKSALAIAFVGPASFLMGGTLPAMGQAVVRAGRLGHEGNLLYGTNTLGGAIGILVATFVLIPVLGMHRSFLVLMAGSAGLAIAALRLASWTAKTPDREASSDEPMADRAAVVPEPALASLVPATSDRTWGLLAFVSGFNVLGLEILALHLFSQVLHNSTYTFATVLVVVIASLAVGALATPRLRIDSGRVLHWLGIALLATALATAFLPRVFFALSGGMQPLGGGVATLGAYVLRILAVSALVLGPSFVLAGWVFPLVLAGAGAEDSPGGSARRGIGARWGTLLGTNAVGALLGSLVANFVCMRFLGLWLSLTIWALLAAVAGILVAARAPIAGRRLRLGLTLASAVGLVAGFPASLPIVALAPGESLLGAQSGADGVAAVVGAGPQLADRRMKYNNTYSLGGTANAAQQARMGQLALLLHPRPEHVGFIGIATGITASAALRDPAVQAITAVELSPQITDLACRYFAEWNGDLCSAPRVRVVVEDGRMFFRATREKFDVVVGDLFVPWQAGTANLYTREQFEAVRDHLSPGGLFVQWLPLFQLDAVGFWGIAATFSEVFPNAWLAIADFQPASPAVALVGWRDAEGAPSHAVLAARCRQVQPLARLREPMLADPTGVATFLVGPVGRVLPSGIPILTLDRPWLADHAPRVQRARPERWFVGTPFVAVSQLIASAVTDDSLRAGVQLGATLLQFCEVVDREGPERGASWLGAHLGRPLPPANFAVEQPGRMNWPFRREAGLLLLARAREAAAEAAGGGPRPR